MSKTISYLLEIPGQIEKYGAVITAKKAFIDILNHLDLIHIIPRETRWKLAHDFHTQWKHYQRTLYGPEEYNRRIDEKSREVLNQFYETGTDFKNQTVLDVGCGTRGILPIINAAVKIGLDPTINRLNPHFTHDPDIIYISRKAEEIPLDTASVDVVSCNNALNHFEDPEKALKEIHRVLKPDGKLLLEVFIERMNIAHTVEFTPESLEALVCSLFKPVKVKHEQLKVKVVIDEKTGGSLPMRWGGVFTKETPT